MKYAKLEDCCEILDSKRIPVTANKRRNGKYPYYGANGLQDYVDDYIFDDELVLLAEDGGNFNSKEKPIAYRVSGKCWVNNHAHVLKPKQGINVDYLCYALMYYDVSGLVNGATRQKLTQATMRKMKIPVLSEIDQLKIVEIIGSIQDLKDNYCSILCKADELVKARFVEMFGSIHDCKIYPYTSTKNLCDVISGGTPSREKSEYWEKGDIPWIRTADLQNEVITESIEYITKKGLDNSSAKLVPPNTILIAMYGQGKTRGMTGYLNIEASTNQACACILPGNKINPVFMWKYYELSYEKLRCMAKGGNQPNLNGNMIKDFLVLLPPMELQNEFVNFVKQVDKSKFLCFHQKKIREIFKISRKLIFSLKFYSACRLWCEIKQYTFDTSNFMSNTLSNMNHNFMWNFSNSCCHNVNRACCTNNTAPFKSTFTILNTSRLSCFFRKYFNEFSNNDFSLSFWICNAR